MDRASRMHGSEENAYRVSVGGNSEVNRPL
jgi:hypothetical protein